MAIKNAAFVDIIKELGGLLLKVDKPARYVGGEVGILAKKDAHLHALIAFPDLYEIGMGNQALRIIYNRMNEIEGVSCDRAFAPAPDFEKLLREKNLPLYGLDTGITMGSLDLLLFTLGYELGLNGILAMLDVSGIPLHCEDRNDAHPILIAGGPAVSNPLPFSPFIDAFWLGEAEAGFFDLVKEVSSLKEKGQGRAELLDHISANKHIFVKGKEKTTRAIFTGFSAQVDTGTSPSADADSALNAAVFPVPSMKIVQHHGAVEIMRGCPNGCRFCHAGFWYRPARRKSAVRILSEVKEMVNKGGWHEISLSSLSSGDYSGIGELVQTLNDQYAACHVSFQMPSLKVSGFSLSLLEKISATRKSGLTFAVETPRDLWQMAINKEVTRDSVSSILDEAKRRGWKTAKFYFMIGLPLPKIEGKSEEEQIVDFIMDIARRAKMHFNINIGLFIPKPHTPYQWAAQLDSAAASEKMNFIRAKLKPLGHKVSVSDPLISRIEGLLSRGDERAGQLCEQAYLGGSRLDAWSEFINKDIWQKLLEENEETVKGFFAPKEDSVLPWNCIDSSVKIEYLRREKERSKKSERTASCLEKCSLCGVCGKKNVEKQQKTAFVNHVKKEVNEKDVENGEFSNLEKEESGKKSVSDKSSFDKKKDPDIHRVLFAFSKKGSAVFHGHLSLIEIFSMAFTRAGLPVIYTQGFNPLVKMEFASPLSVGIKADGEIAAVDFVCEIITDNFIRTLNENLPEGLRIEKAETFYIPSGMKKHSVSSLLWGFSYAGLEDTDFVKSTDDKSYRQSRLVGSCSSLFDFNRIEVLAKNLKDDTNLEKPRASYFDIYPFLYPIH